MDINQVPCLKSVILATWRLRLAQAKKTKKGYKTPSEVIAGQYGIPVIPSHCGKHKIQENHSSGWPRYKCEVLFAKQPKHKGPEA
jgi:hypothetical protein